MFKFVQKFTLLDNIYFCTGFSTSESNSSGVLASSFLANNLYNKHRITEIRTNMADCPQTDATDVVDIGIDIFALIIFSI